ncbi:MAG: hypothetical protein JJE49_10615, partial [Peptostreptococcaceae bacterium]|nr:hypothetical protein [Peptostreptococcaceae bacterium]
MMKNIEYALSVSGIIDTIMVPEDYRNEFMNTHKDESDLFMMIDGSADINETRSLCKYLVPEEGAVGLSLISQAERFLRSIGDSKDFKNYIGTDGTFRLGQISGVADKNYEPVMIGETTRIEHMAKMIAGLEFEIADEKSAVEECLVKINEVEREITILEKEKDGFPDTEDLEIEKSRLENAERKIGQLSEESQRAKSEFDSLTFEAKALISQAKSLLNNRQIDYTSGGIASAIDIIYEVTFGIRELSNEQRAMLGMLKSCERASFDLIDKKTLIGGIRDHIYEGRKDLSDIESQLEAIIEILDSSEDKEKLEKIKICEGIVKSYSGNNDAIHDNITSISTEIATIQVTIDEKNQSKAVALEKKNVLREMLERMMELYKVKESFDEVS